jgi:predicted GTPase
MSVIMIGSTGNGKSTLGNFLHNPDPHHMFDEQTFLTARDNKPQTQHVKAVTSSVSVLSKEKSKVSYLLTLIDTPGLNENAVRDLSHMIKIIQELQIRREIQACIFVVKFNSKIDSQYKSTIQYYSKLLPSLFNKNVLVVMTDFATDARSEALRQRQRIDVDQVKRNAIREICQNANMWYEPITFMVDCLPFDDSEKQLNLSVRDAILQYIHQLQPVRIGAISVAKTAYIREEDDKYMNQLEGEVNGYNERLIEANAGSQEALREAKKLETKVTNETKKCQKLKSSLEEKDSTDTIVAKSWSVDESWKFLRWLNRSFEITSLWQVTDIVKWTNGNCKFEDFSITDRGAKGRVEGKFMRGIYASVELQTTKQIKFANEIHQLRESLTEAESNLKQAKTDRDNVQNKHKEYADKIELLQQYIEQKRERIKNLSSDFMSIEEAIGKHNEITKKMIMK